MRTSGRSSRRMPWHRLIEKILEIMKNGFNMSITWALIVKVTLVLDSEHSISQELIGL
jgi:hypothetical protein